MKIVNFNTEDTGGQVERLSRLINRHTKHQSRGFVNNLNYINYPVDVIYRPKWRTIPEWIAKYWQTADVIHAHNKWTYLRKPLRITKIQSKSKQFPKKKTYSKTLQWPITNPKAGRIIHQHGRMPTSRTMKIIKKADRLNRSLRVVSTINLLRYVDDDPKRWFPTPIDLPYMEQMKSKFYKEHDTINIMHSPTQRHLKHTDLFLKVMKKIQEKHNNVKLLLVERQTYEKTQMARASADICYDQLLLQHGSNGLESMSMKIPVIAGCIKNPNVKEKIEDITGCLPFVNANESTLYDVLEQLITDESLRKEYGRIGYDYIKKWHCPPYVTDHAIETYKEAKSMVK